MSVTIRFKANRAGIAEIGRSPDMVAEMQRRALLVRGYARETAPVDTGNYRAQITADAGVENGLAYGRVTARALYSIWIEFGTSKMAAFRTLGIALRAAAKG